MDQHSIRPPVFVAIDVAKDRLEVHLLPSGDAFAVTRDHAGLERLVAHLRQTTPALVVLEATGGFEITVAAAQREYKSGDRPGYEPTIWPRSWPRSRLPRSALAHFLARVDLEQAQRSGLTE